MSLLAVYTTVASREEALTMAKALVERRLAACAQIEEIESVYRWEGALHHDCLLYTSPSPRDGLLSRMPSSA